jgi:hypothetical protein
VDHEGLARNVFKKPFINSVEIARNHSTEFFFQNAMSVVDGNLKVYYDHRIKKDRNRQATRLAEAIWYSTNTWRRF